MSDDSRDPPEVDTDPMGTSMSAEPAPPEVTPARASGAPPQDVFSGFVPPTRENVDVVLAYLESLEEAPAGPPETIEQLIPDAAGSIASRHRDQASRGAVSARPRAAVEHDTFEQQKVVVRGEAEDDLVALPAGDRGAVTLPAIGKDALARHLERARVPPGETGEIGRTRANDTDEIADPPSAETEELDEPPPIEADDWDAPNSDAASSEIVAKDKSRALPFTLLAVMLVLSPIVALWLASDRDESAETTGDSATPPLPSADSDLPDSAFPHAADDPRAVEEIATSAASPTATPQHERPPPSPAPEPPATTLVPAPRRPPPPTPQPGEEVEPVQAKSAPKPLPEPSRPDYPDAP